MNLQFEQFSEAVGFFWEWHKHLHIQLEYGSEGGSERCNVSLIEENTNTKHTHKRSEAQWLSDAIHTN